MFVEAVGLALPERRYTKTECWDAFAASAWIERLTPRSRAITKAVLQRDNGIEARFLAVDALEEVFAIDPDTLHRRFARHAPQLASSAAAEALARANLAASEIDAVLVSTCTGYLCPGLSGYVSERLALRRDVLGFDLVGQGCAGALPNWQLASALLDSGRCEHVLSICVEVSTAAMYLDDDPGVLISACLFGDGAGAAVLSNQPQSDQRRVEWKFGSSCLLPDQRDTLRFSHKNGMLRNILLPQVPQIAGDEVARLLNGSLTDAGVKRDRVAGWILHTGGRDVLLSLRDKLALSESDIRHSTAVLREFGNLSSPTVYFVLDRALHDAVPDGLWWMSAFGAGFSCHGALLEVGGVKRKS